MDPWGSVVTGQINTWPPYIIPEPDKFLELIYWTSRRASALVLSARSRDYRTVWCVQIIRRLRVGSIGYKSSGSVRKADAETVH